MAKGILGSLLGGGGGRGVKNPSKTRGAKMYRAEQAARKEGAAHDELVRLATICAEYQKEHARSGNGSAVKARALEQARVAKKAGATQKRIDEVLREAGISF